MHAVDTEAVVAVQRQAAPVVLDVATDEMAFNSDANSGLGGGRVAGNVMNSLLKDEVQLPPLIR